MGHLRAYRAAVGGKLPGNNAIRTAKPLVIVRRLIAVAALFVAMMSAPASYAQSGGAFAGLAGVWSGVGTVMLDDGSTEKIRCRATYAVAPNGTVLNQTLLCASDSYKFNLSSNLISSSGALSGTWNEASKNVSGSLEGRGSNGSFEVVASSPGFTANISLTTRGNKQSVVIKAESQFKGASITLSRS
jgi:hypothetical protein